MIESPLAQHQVSECDAAKWNSAIINWIFYTHATLTAIRQNGFNEKGLLNDADDACY